MLDYSFSPAEAKAHAEKQAAGKVKKGYKEAKVKAVKKVTKKKAAKKKAIKKKVTKKATKKKPKWYEEGSVEDKVEWAEEWSPEDTSLDINWLAEDVERDVREAVTGNEAVQDELLRMYREKPDFSVLLELLTDLDEGLQEWRYRHVKLAERTIGTKIGTGGSDGVQFLKKTLFQSLFPDLWAIRSRM